MTWILLSVLCSVVVSALLKLAPRYAVDVRQAITGNYLVAALLALVLFHPDPALLMLPVAHPAWRVLLALGVLLPSIFVVLARSVEHVGVVRSDAAQRLSLLLSLVAAFTLFGEALTWPLGIGGLLGLVAIACIVARNRGRNRGQSAFFGRNRGQSAFFHQPDRHGTPISGVEKCALEKCALTPISAGGWWWPLGVFFGFGAIDILFKRMAQLTRVPFTDVLFATFVLAFILAGIVLAWMYATGRARWRWRNAGGALVLGAFNFGNILFYIEAHRHFAHNPALVFSAMNIGVIVLATLVGVWFFREHPSRLNRVGLVVAVAAVLVLAVA